MGVAGGLGMGVGKCVYKENPKSDLDLDLGFVNTFLCICVISIWESFKKDTWLTITSFTLTKIKNQDIPQMMLDKGQFGLWLIKLEFKLALEFIISI